MIDAKIAVSDTAFKKSIKRKAGLKEAARRLTTVEEKEILEQKIRVKREKRKREGEEELRKKATKKSA